MSPETPAPKPSYQVEAELRTRGELVTVEEVIKCRLLFHAKCSGKGWTGKKTAPVLCSCAIKRFLSRNVGKVVPVEGGEWAWRRKAA